MKKYIIKNTLSKILLLCIAYIACLNSTIQSQSLTTHDKLYYLEDFIDSMEKGTYRNQPHELENAFKSITDYVNQQSIDDFKDTNLSYKLLYLSIVNSYAPLIEALIDKNINLNKKITHNYTPLALACALSTPAIVTLLIKSGAEVNTHLGQRPIISVRANPKNTNEIIQILIAAGADINFIESQSISTLKDYISFQAFLKAYLPDNNPEKQEIVSLNNLLDSLIKLQNEFESNTINSIKKENDPTVIKLFIMNTLNLNPSKIIPLSEYFKDISIKSIIKAHKQLNTRCLTTYLENRKKQKRNFLLPQDKNQLTDLDIISQL